MENVTMEKDVVPTYQIIVVLVGFEGQIRLEVDKTLQMSTV